MARQKHQGHKTAKESTKPGEPKPADQYGRISHQFAGALQYVIEACPHQAGKSCNADDEKPFVVMAGLAATLLVAALYELCAAAVKICLQDVCGGQQAGGNHKAKGRNCERPKMEKRNHRWRSDSPSKVYTRVRSRPIAALIRTLISPSLLLKLPE